MTILTLGSLIILFFVVGFTVGLNIYTPAVDKEGCEFGSAAASYGNYFIVGADGNTANITYIYELDESKSEKDIIPSIGLHEDRYFNDVVFSKVNNYQSYLFGKSVDIYGNIAVVGAPGSYVFDPGFYPEYDELTGTTQNEPNPNYVKNAGMVFIFEKNYKYGEENEPMFKGKCYLTKKNSIVNTRFGNKVKLFNENILIVGTSSSELLIYNIGDDQISNLENNRFLYDGLISNNDDIERLPYMEPIQTLSCPTGEICGSFGKDKIVVYGDYLFIGDSGYKVTDERKVGGIFVYKYVENEIESEQEQPELFTGFKFLHVIKNNLNNNGSSNFGKSFDIQANKSGYDLIIGAPGTELFMGSEPDSGIVTHIELDLAFRELTASQRVVTDPDNATSVKFTTTITPEIVYPPYPTKGDNFGEEIIMKKYNDITLVAVSSSRKKMLDGRKGIVSLYKLIEYYSNKSKTSKKLELLFTMTEITGYNNFISNGDPKYPDNISNIGYAKKVIFAGNNLVIGVPSFSYNIEVMNDDGTNSTKLIKNGAFYIYNLDEMLKETLIPEMLLPISYYTDILNYSALVLFKNYKGEYIGEESSSSLNPPTISLQCGTTSYKPPTLFFESINDGQVSISIKKKCDENINGDCDDDSYISTPALSYNLSINGVLGMVCTFEMSGVGYASTSYYDHTMYVGDVIHTQTIDDNGDKLDDSNQDMDSKNNMLISSSNSNNINSILLSRFTSDAYLLQYSTTNPLESIKTYMDLNNIAENVNPSVDLLYAPPVPLYYDQLSILFTINIQSEKNLAEETKKDYSIYSVVLPETLSESKYVVYDKPHDNSINNNLVQTFDYMNIKATSPVKNIGEYNLNSEVVLNNKIISGYSFGSIVSNDGSTFVLGTNTSTESLLLTQIDEKQEKYLCDLMDGIREYDLENGALHEKYGVNEDNNIQVLDDIGIVVVGAKHVNAVYIMDYSCKVMEKIARPDGTHTKKDNIHYYDKNTKETTDYTDGKVVTIPLASFGASVKLIPLSEINRIDYEAGNIDDYILFVGSPGDILLDVSYLIDDFSNIRPSISELLNIICLGEVYMFNISITKSNEGKITVINKDKDSKNIKVIPCSTRNNDLSFGDKIEVNYSGLFISSTLKINTSSVISSGENSIPVTISDTTYYIPIADGAIEVFIIDKLSFNEEQSLISEFTYIADIDLLSTFGLKNDFALFGKNVEIIPTNNGKYYSEFKMFISAQWASISYNRQGAVIECDANMANANYVDGGKYSDKASFGGINYIGNYSLVMKCDRILTSKKKCANCSFGNAMSVDCNRNMSRCALVIGEDSNNSYSTRSHSGAAHYYLISTDIDPINIQFLGTKNSLYSNEDERFGAGVGISLLNRDETDNIDFVSVVGSPGTTTAYGYNSGLVNVMRSNKIGYSVKLIGENGDDPELGNINNMATIWNGATYNMLVTSHDIFGNLARPSNVDIDYDCFDMVSTSEKINNEIDITENGSESLDDVYLRYRLSVSKYSGGMCKINIHVGGNTVYSFSVFPDASRSKFSVGREPDLYDSTQELFEQLKNTIIDNERNSKGLVMNLCIYSENNAKVKKGIDYDLVQFNTNCVLPSGKMFHPLYAGNDDGCYKYVSELPIISQDMCTIRAYSHYYNLDVQLELDLPPLSTVEIVFLVLGILAVVLLVVWVGIVIGCEGKPVSEVLSCAKCCYADYDEVDGSMNSDFGESLIPSSNSSGTPRTVSSN